MFTESDPRPIEEETFKKNCFGDKIAPFTPSLNTKPFFAVKIKITIPNDLHHWKARTEQFF